MKPYFKLFLASFLILLACLGFGRFAFGMIIPNMQENLRISTTLVGFISSSNFVGYFLGIMVASKIYSIFNTPKLIFLLLFVQGLSMLTMILFRQLYFYLCFISIIWFFSRCCKYLYNGIYFTCSSKRD